MQHNQTDPFLLWMSDKKQRSKQFSNVGFEPPRFWIMQALGWCRIMRMTFLRKFCKSQKNNSSTAAYCSCMFVCYPNNFQGDSPWTIEFLNSATVGMLRCTSKNNTTPLTATVEFYLAPLPHGAQVFNKLCVWFQLFSKINTTQTILGG